MTDTIVKTLAALVPADDTSDAPHGAFEVILSTPTTDRDGEQVKTAEWKMPLPDHITFDVDHGMSVASTVGSGVPRLEADGTLHVSGTYASTELAQQTRALVNEGHIRTTSVAFLRSTDHKAGTTSRELLNGAFVAVPANPEALILSSKAMQDAAEKIGARHNSSDLKAIQTAHDVLVDAGATCTVSMALATSVVSIDSEDPAIIAAKVLAHKILNTEEPDPEADPSAAAEPDPADDTSAGNDSAAADDDPEGSDADELTRRAYAIRRAGLQQLIS